MLARNKPDEPGACGREVLLLIRSTIVLCCECSLDFLSPEVANLKGTVSPLCRLASYQITALDNRPDVWPEYLCFLVAL